MKETEGHTSGGPTKDNLNLIGEQIRKVKLP